MLNPAKLALPFAKLAKARPSPQGKKGGPRPMARNAGHGYMVAPSRRPTFWIAEHRCHTTTPAGVYQSGRSFQNKTGHTLAEFWVEIGGRNSDTKQFCDVLCLSSQVFQHQLLMTCPNLWLPSDSQISNFYQCDVKAPVKKLLKWTIAIHQHRIFPVEFVLPNFQVLLQGHFPWEARYVSYWDRKEKSMQLYQLWNQTKQA